MLSSRKDGRGQTVKPTTDGSSPVSLNLCAMEMKDRHNESKPSNKKTDATAAKKVLFFALFCGLLSGLFFSLCAACVKYLKEVDPAQVALYQYMAIAAFSLPMLIHVGENPLGPKGSCRYWLVLCGAIDAVTAYLSFISFRYLPLADATVLTSSVPVFVTITARIFLKEKCGTAQILAIVVSAAGVTLVTKVPLLMANRTQVYTRENVIGILACLGSIATESAVYIILRKIHDLNLFVILFNFGCVATFVNAALTLMFGRFTLTACGVQKWLVIAVGIFSFLSQLLLTKALELEEAGPVSVLMAAGDIILAFILDTTLFADSPDGYTISGTVLVISSVIAVGFKTSINDAATKFFARHKIFRTRNKIFRKQNI